MREHPRGRWTGLVRELGLGLVVAGVVVVLFVAYDLVGTNFAERSSQARLARQFSAAVSGSGQDLSAAGAGPTGPSAPTYAGAGGHPLRTSLRPSGRSPSPSARAAGRSPGPSVGEQVGQKYLGRRSASAHLAAVALPVPPPGGALAHLVIPAIGVDRYVVQGVDEQDLQMGPGHYPGTALPGEVGNAAIAGHRTTFGAPFFRLNELKAGDLVYLTDMGGTTWVYSVQRLWVVAPSDVGVLAPTRGAELTLTTCNPRFWATTRLIARARLAGRLARGAKLLDGAGRLPASLAALERARGSQASNQSRPAASSRSTTGAQAPVRLLPATPLPGLPPSAQVGSTSGASTSKGDSPVVGSLSGSGAGAGTWGSATAWGTLALAVWVLARVLAGRRRRWAKAGVIVAGALVALVPLWFAFGAVVELLPANF